MEFHAVILCGPGKSLSPFSKIRNSGTAKALLPVANRPIIENVLDWCELAFFPKVTLIVDESSEADIKAYVDQYKSKLSKINQDKQSHDEISPYISEINLVSLQSDFSGNVIHYLYKNHRQLQLDNFIILPCDLITNLPPQVLIEAYRNKNDNDIGLLVSYRNTLAIEDKKNRIFPNNYTIYAELPDDQKHFLDYYSHDDINFHKALKLRTQMCWRYPNSIISSKLLNGSIFFGSGLEIFKIFDENPEKFTEQYFNSRSITKVIRDLSRRSWKHSKPLQTIGFLIVPEKATFFRVNNTPVLMEANRYLMQKQAASNAQNNNHNTQKDKAAANVGIDSLVGENTTLGERTNVKKTVIGKNCKIGKRVRLTGNLIMDNVTIEDDVQLENCIIGSNVIIHSKLKLFNCNVESKHEIQNGSHFKGETLLSLTLEELVDEDGLESDEVMSGDLNDSDESDEGDSEESSEFDEEEYGDNSDGLFDY